jgi:hypothetical protein
MKPLIVTAIVAAGFFCAGCGRRYEDVIATQPSPDGAIIAASNRNSGEFPFEAQYEEVRLYPRGGRLRDGDVILSYGEEGSNPTFKWVDAQHLSVQLPCGWWSSLTNHYQLPKTSRIIDIAYGPPPTNCPRTMTSSLGLPTTVADRPGQVSGGSIPAEGDITRTNLLRRRPYREKGTAEGTRETQAGLAAGSI